MPSSLAECLSNLLCSTAVSQISVCVSFETQSVSFEGDWFAIGTFRRSKNVLCSVCVTKLNTFLDGLPHLQISIAASPGGRKDAGLRVAGVLDGRVRRRRTSQKCSRSLAMLTMTPDSLFASSFRSCVVYCSALSVLHLMLYLQSDITTIHVGSNWKYTLNYTLIRPSMWVGSKVLPW